MRRHAIAIASFIAIVVSVAPQFAGAQTAAPATPPALEWGAAPPVFEPGAQMAVLQGDPSKAGEEFTVRLRLPNGYKIAPHTHPTTENITVIEGTFLGLGLLAWVFFEASREGIEKQRLLDLAHERGVELDEGRARRAVAAGHGALLEERLTAAGNGHNRD